MIQPPFPSRIGATVSRYISDHKNRGHKKPGKRRSVGVAVLAQKGGGGWHKASVGRGGVGGYLQPLGPMMLPYKCKYWIRGLWMRRRARICAPTSDTRL